jgi:hypothetical protein
MGTVTLFTASEYEAQEFDAVLVRDAVVVCVRADDEDIRLVPMDKVNHLDGPADALYHDTEIPESFYGGADYGFIDVDQFPEIETHLEDLAGEQY